MSGTGTFKVILASDQSIDYDACDMSTYLAERDVSTLAFVDGESPTVYHCRPLTLQERRDVRNKATEGDRYEAAFVRGLVRVERLLHEDGERRDWTKPDDRSGKSKPIPDSVLERYFDEVAIQEVGMMVWARSFLARGSRGYYPLPDICLRALTVSAYHRAALTKDSSSSATSNASPAEQSEQITSQGSES